jgi:hypothetical protein
MKPSILASIDIIAVTTGPLDPAGWTLQTERPADTLNGISIPILVASIILRGGVPSTSIIPESLSSYSPPLNGFYQFALSTLVSDGTPHSFFGTIDSLTQPNANADFTFTGAITGEFIAGPVPEPPTRATGFARACRHLSQTSAQTRCNPARKFRAVFS